MIYPTFSEIKLKLKKKIKRRLPEIISFAEEFDYVNGIKIIGINYIEYL